MNASELIRAENYLGRTSFSINEVLNDWCTQIDQKIIFCCLLILTFYVLYKIVAPRSYNAFEGTKFNEIHNLIVDKFISLSETLALISAVLILIFGYIQYEFSIGQLIWIGILILFVILSFIGDKIGIKRKNRKNF